MITFGRWLKDVVDRSGLSMRDFSLLTEEGARQLEDLHGLERGTHGAVSHPTISRAISTHYYQTDPWRAPTLATLYQIAVAAKVPASVVFGLFVPLGDTSVPAEVAQLWRDPGTRQLLEALTRLPPDRLRQVVEYVEFLERKG